MAAAPGSKAKTCLKMAHGAREDLGMALRCDSGSWLGWAVLCEVLCTSLPWAGCCRWKLGEQVTGAQWMWSPLLCVFQEYPQILLDQPPSLSKMLFKHILFFWVFHPTPRFLKCLTLGSNNLHFLAREMLGTTPGCFWNGGEAILCVRLLLALLMQAWPSPPKGSSCQSKLRKWLTVWVRIPQLKHFLPCRVHHFWHPALIKHMAGTEILAVLGGLE